MHCFDPFGVSGRPTAHYNPLDPMDASDIDLVDDVAAQADAIVQDDDAGGDATHWLEPIKYDKRRHRRRSRIEIMFGRLKDWRRVATRYDRCPAVFLSAIALAATVIFWL